MDLSQYSATARLRDGNPLQLRAIRPGDKQRLSGRSVYFRFMGAKHDLSPAELKYFTEVDFRHHIAIVAALETAAGEQPIGVGRLIEMDAGPNERVAEVAFVVEDEYQNLGAGTVLFEHIVRIARSEGFTRLHADVHAGNSEMLDIFRHSRFDIESRTDAGVEHLKFDIA